MLVTMVHTMEILEQPVMPVVSYVPVENTAHLMDYWQYLGIALAAGTVRLDLGQTSQAFLVMIQVPTVIVQHRVLAGNV